jgi:putative DNA primase/helicase
MTTDEVPDYFAADAFDDEPRARVPHVGEDAPPVPDDERGRWTDVGQAYELASVLGRLMWVPDVGWFRWDGSRWAPEDEVTVTDLVSAHYRRQAASAAHRAGELVQAADTTGADRKLKEAIAYRKRQSARSIRDVIYLLKARVALGWDGDTPPGARLDRNPPGRALLNTPDGVVDLRTGELMDHDPALLMTKVTAGRYLPGYSHSDWRAAMKSLPLDTLNWLQLRMGYAITGEPGPDVVFLNGHGKNGKSLFTNDGVLRALGSYGLLLSNRVLAQGKTDAGAATPDKASLRGCRFVLVEELDDESSFNLSTTAIKEMAGTGQITARMLFKDAITFDVTHSVFVNTNHVPVVTATDWGTWRRLSLVPFPWRFATTPEGDDERQAIAGLDRRLKEGAEGQHDAMVTWLVEGAKLALADPSPVLDIDERRDDDRRAPSVKSATWAWRKSCDRLMAYAEDHLVFDPGAEVAKADLLAHFNTWQAQNGNKAWSASLLRDRMKSHSDFRHIVAGLYRPSNQNKITRPDLPVFELPKLPARPEVYPGIRFRQEAPKMVITPALIEEEELS